MANVVTTLTLDITQVRQAISQVDASMSDFRDKLKEVQEAQKAAFSAKYSDFVQGVKGANNVLREQVQTLKELEQYEKALLSARRKSSDAAEIKKLNAELNKTRAAMAEINEKGGSFLQSFRQELEGGGGGLQGFVSQLGSVGIVAAGIVGTLTPIAKEAITVANEFEQVRVSFAAMLQSNFKAAQLQQQLVEMAAKTPFELKNINEAAKQLIAYGVDADNITSTLTVLGNIAAGVGQDKLPQLIRAFGQVKAATRLTGEEINQFTEAGVPLIEALANTLQKPAREIKKLASDGKISFNDLQKALESVGTGAGKFAGLMEKQSQTLSGVFSSFKDNFTTNVLLPLGDFLAMLAKPLLQGVNAFFKDTENGAQMAAAGLYRMSSEMNNQVNALIANKTATDSLRISKEAEAKIREDLNRNIKEIGLPLAVSEKTTAEEYVKVLKAVNDELDKKIKKTVVDAKLTELRTKEFEIIMKQGDAAVRLQKEEKRLNDERQKGYKGVSLGTASISGGLQELGKIDAVTNTREEIQQLERDLANTRNQIETVTKTAEQWGVSLKDAAVVSKKGVQMTNDELEKAAKKREQLLQKAEDNELKRMKFKIDFMADGLEKELEQERYKNKQSEIEINRAFRAEILSQKSYNELKKLNKEDLVKELAAIELKYENELYKIRAEARKAEQDENEKAFKAEIDRRKMFTQTIKDETVRSIEVLKIERDERLAALREQGATLQQIVLTYEDYQKKIDEVNRSANDKQVKANDEILKLTLEQTKARFDADLLVRRQAFLSVQRSDVEVQEYEKREAEAKKRFDLGLSAERLKIEIETQKALSDATTEAGKKRIEILEEQYRGALAAMNTQEQTEGQSFFDRIANDLGINDRQQNAIIEGLNVAKKYISDYYEFRLKLAEQLVQQTEKEVESRERALDREIELAQLGYANNVDLRQRELADAKAAQDKALQQQKEAQRTKILLESAEQVSGLVTSSANFYKALSPLGIAGVAIATALTAAMFGAFVTAKSKALELTKFREGGQGFVDGDGIARGRNHENGGVKLEIEGDEAFHLGRTNGKTRFAVVNRKMTAKHFDLLSAINKDDRNAMREHLAELVPQTNVPAVQQVVNVSNERISERENRNAQLLQEMQINNAFWKKSLQQGEATFTDLGDTILIRQGNKTTIKRKS